MSLSSHLLQWLYLGTPLFSLVLFVLMVAVLFANIGLRNLNWWGWTFVGFFILGMGANAYVFLKVYGVYAARSVLG